MLVVYLDAVPGVTQGCSDDLLSETTIDKYD